MSNSFYASHLFICTNRRDCGSRRGSCATRGAEELRSYAKERMKQLKIPNIRINTAGCLDRCELGPVLVIYPDAVWYHFRSRDDVDEILTEHVINGRPVHRLMLASDQKFLSQGPAPETGCL